jgi:hypothetical protein
VSGSKLAAKKAAMTNRRKFGANYYAVIGAQGGSVKVPKGFAITRKKQP